MVAVGAAVMLSTTEPGVPLPHKFTGVTVKVPPVAPAEKVTAFDGDTVLAAKVAPVPE